MPRKQGGKRQGTPGTGYSNRTDLQTNMAPTSAASGSMDTPAAGGMMGMIPLGAPSPDDTPNLSTPTEYPDEPVTAGLPIGPGAGPEMDTRLEDTRNMKHYLPILDLYLDRPETPPSVMRLYRYIRGS